ncbi:MAG: hypothetical protein E7264_00810 [Lachnospiraceae bacterium]|nr:hypothetical protein [Lachnospiraceae bacterium]
MLVFIIFVVLMLFPFCRFLLFNTPRILFGLIPDTYKYIRFKRWRECNSFGKIICYTGLFGQGKTKECVRYITNQYKQYNGLMVYDFESKKWVQQRIVVYSNVELTIPYVKLVSMQQLVDCQNSEVGTVNLFLIDEASVVFNSREFKNNFSTPALNTILTSRHHKIGVYLTAQRFSHIDALLRQVTTSVYECSYFKPLRIQKISVFDAWEVENCNNLTLMKPVEVLYHYTTDKDYSNYDTYAMVESVSKDCVDKKYIDDSEILARQGVSNFDSNYISKPTSKMKKRYR